MWRMAGRREWRRECQILFSGAQQQHKKWWAQKEYTWNCIWTQENISFTIKLIKHRLSKEVSPKVSTFEIFRTHPDTVLSKLLELTLLEQGLHKKISRGALSAAVILWLLIWSFLKFYLFGSLSRKNNGCSHTTLLITEFVPQIGYKDLTTREINFSRLLSCKQLSIFVLYERQHSFNPGFILRSLL